MITAGPHAVISPSEAVATVDKSITFTCNVSGHPLPTIDYWKLANDATHYTVGDQPKRSRVEVSRFDVS